MSRHTAVKRMIQKGTYIDEDGFSDHEEDDYEPPKGNDDIYADYNFEKDELVTIREMTDEFEGIFKRTEIIDALYATEGDPDAARDYLLKKKCNENTQKQQKSKTIPTPTQKQEQPQMPQKQQQLIEAPLPLLQKQPSLEAKSKNHYHLDFTVERFNRPYNSVKYKTKEPANKLINVVIAGHVDTGKSTLVGKLLQVLKMVDDREVHKQIKEAKRVNKEASSLAFLSDQTQEEKERGITMDIAYKCVNIGDKNFNLLDSPGHKDFVPHMITGASQADYAILVVDVCQNAFENSMKQGSIQEHLYLITAIGVKQVIVAINKMDLIEWDLQQFKKVTNVLESIMLRIGFIRDNIDFVPISSMQGQNINTKFKCNWDIGRPFVDYLSQLPIPVRRSDRPPRFMITNKYHQYEGKLRGTCVFGKVLSGQIEKGQSYVALPQGILLKVKDITDAKITSANEGSIVELGIQTLVDNEFQNLKQGQIICSLDQPIPCSNLFTCTISTLEIETPFIRGTTLMMHMNATKVPVVLKKMNVVYHDGNLQVKRKFPRAICMLEYAEVELESDQLICVETFDNVPSLSQFVLREKYKTVAIGKVVSIGINQAKLKESKILHEQQI